MPSRTPEGPESLKCSFCGKSQRHVKKLIAGPGVYICDECIELCNDIVEDELAEEAAVEPLLDELPVPSAIHESLNNYVVGPGAREEGPLGSGLQPLQARPPARLRRTPTRSSSPRATS